MKKYLALTIIADDRHGIVDRLAGVIRDHRANWMDSSLASLAGKFAGILLVDVDEDALDSLIQSLEGLEGDGIEVVAQTTTEVEPGAGDHMEFSIEGSDRPGIVSEMSQLLAASQISLDQLKTVRVVGSMSGLPLFQASARVRLPPELKRADLRRILESLAPDLMVEFAPD